MCTIMYISICQTCTERKLTQLFITINNCCEYRKTYLRLYTKYVINYFSNGVGLYLYAPKSQEVV